MAREIPRAPKVHTTVYDNFKGVDYTNDSTNIWRRRSPTGVNMLPDASGRPFKRHGWEVLISQSTLCDTLGVDECKIIKLSYFELAGIDHIVIFTDMGVVFYNTDGVVAYSTLSDVYGGYDRCFFFEGGGTSAFYIYNNYRVWMYYVKEDGTFAFEEVTENVTIPTVLVGADATCVGTLLQGYNLLGQYASVLYDNCDLRHWWCSDGIALTVDGTTFDSATTLGKFYVWKYTSGSWTPDTSIGGSEASLALSSSGITVQGVEEEGMTIVAVRQKGVMLPNNVSQQQVSDGKVQVFGSTSLQFDTPLTVITEGNTPSSGTCIGHTDPVGKTAWIEFDLTQAGSWGADWTVTGEDSIKTIFPVASITTTSYDGIDQPKPVDTDATPLDCEVV